jgi:hypothetical protein
MYLKEGATEMTTRKKATKPAVGDNSWLGNTVGGARLQIINEETNKWQTVGSCIDTPNVIAKETAKPKYKGLSLWLFDGYSRKPLF